MELIAVSRLPTKWGLFQAYCYQSKLDGTEHIAVVKVMRFISVTCRSSRMLRFFFGTVQEVEIGHSTDDLQ